MCDERQLVYSQINTILTWTCSPVDLQPASWVLQKSAADLLVRFPNLGSDDVIIPGTANLSFNIELTSAIDANRTLVSNIGRAIIKKLAVKF